MNHRYHSKTAQFWANDQLVGSGNHCRLIVSYIQKNLFRFDASLVSDAFEKFDQFLRHGRVA